MDFRKHLFSGIVLQGIGLSLFAQTDKPNIVVIMTCLLYTSPSPRDA